MTTAEEIVREEFVKNYAAYVTKRETRASPSSKNLKVNLELIYY